MMCRSGNRVGEAGNFVMGMLQIPHLDIVFSQILGDRVLSLGIVRRERVQALQHGSPIRKCGVSNYFFWEEFGVVAPEICLERKRFERG
jgi:hypothetical protein